MRIAIIVAVSRNGVIGRDGGLPWRLPGDLRRFRALTLGKTVVMGRRTHESIGRPLPGRRNIVLTRGAPDLPPGVEAAADLRSALDRARETCGGGEVFVIGGAEVYREALAVADVIHMTLVDADVEGTAGFPPDPGPGWTRVGCVAQAAGGGDEHPYSFVTFERAPRGAGPGRVSAGSA